MWKGGRGYPWVRSGVGSLGCNPRARVADDHPLDPRARHAGKGGAGGRCSLGEPAGSLTDWTAFAATVGGSSVGLAGIAFGYLESRQRSRQSYDVLVRSAVTRLLTIPLQMVYEAQVFAERPRVARTTYAMGNDARQSIMRLMNELFAARSDFETLIPASIWPKVHRPVGEMILRTVEYLNMMGQSGARVDAESEAQLVRVMEARQTGRPRTHAVSRALYSAEAARAETIR